jgi:hypothetical protein
MAEVRGAGSDKSDRGNPSVQSKFDRNHGSPRKPAPVTHPGATAPMTGTEVAGHTNAGHQMPREVGHAAGTFSHRHIDTHGSEMAMGEKHGSMLNKSQSDRIEGHKPQPVHDKKIPGGGGRLFGGTRSVEHK